MLSMIDSQRPVEFGKAQFRRIPVEGPLTFELLFAERVADTLEQVGVFLHQITMHEPYAGAILVYNTTFRGGERSATNARH